MSSFGQAPKCTLVPSNFFNPAKVREALESVAVLKESDKVEYLRLPQFDAYFVYVAVPESNKSGDGSVGLPPELYSVLGKIPGCQDYNKIVCSWKDSYLHLAVAQGKSLLLANVFEAPDFTTAEYYIFLSLKSLQLNPEVSSICFLSPIGQEEKMSLYRYFKSVVSL